MCLCGVVAYPTPASAALAEGTALDPDEFESQILAIANKHRMAAGLKPVRTVNACLDRLSEGWAVHLAATGDFEHRNQRRILRRCNLNWTGENLIRGTGFTPAAAVKSWLGSPGHRAVLMKPRASLAGIGVSIDDQGHIVGVLNFGDVS
jgi:uncharacterized protein YkwD